MPLSNYALNNFVSQQLSELSECNALDVEREYPQARFWVSNFVLNSIIRFSVPKEGRTFALFFLRRAEAAFTEYAYARQALDEFVSTTPKKPSVYFRALHHFETTVAMLSQAYDLINRTILKPEQKRVFQPDDGSKHQRLNRIYNTNRHFMPSELPEDNIHAVWITNDSLKTQKYSLLYSELVELLAEIGTLADCVSQGKKPDSD